MKKLPLALAVLSFCLSGIDLSRSAINYIRKMVQPEIDPAKGAAGQISFLMQVITLPESARGGTGHVVEMGR